MTNGPFPVLRVDVQSGLDGARLVVSGDLDMSGVDSLVRAANTILDGSAGVLTVDLAEVGFCDSAGINGLVGLRNRCDRAGWSFRLVNLRPQVHRVVVDLTGLGDFLNVVSESERP